MKYLLVLLLLGVTLACSEASSGLAPSPPVGRPPVFHQAGLSVQGFLDDAGRLSYPIVAVDPEGGAVSLDIIEAPEGARLLNGILEWEPPREHAGKAFPFTIRAKNTLGVESRYSFVLLFPSRKSEGRTTPEPKPNRNGV